MEKKLSYSFKERERLTEVVREQAEEIRILLEGGSGFRKIKEHMGSLHKELDMMELNAMEHRRGAEFVRSIMGNIDEIFRNRSEPETVIKKKRARKPGEGGDSDAERERELMMGRRGFKIDQPVESHRSSINKSSLKETRDNSRLRGDGLREDMFETREDYLIAKNN